MKYLKKNLKTIDGIECMELSDETSKKISNFYKVKPFPNYKDNDDKISIAQKGENNLLAKQFKNFCGYNKKILEVGCGTGQLSIYFSMGNNNLIVSLDATFDSLNVAKKFSKKNNINNIKFVNSDIFDDVLCDEFFDFIWCNGVLHHTKNPYEGFKIILKSLKKNGYILIGLYNKYGRLRTLIRKFFFKIFGRKFLDLFDPTLKKLKISEDEKDSWIQDQYLHPKESLHSMDEVLDWFKNNNVEFISSIPACDLEFDNYSKIFEKKKNGNLFSRILNQILMLFGTLGSDGGLFVMIGKKNV